MKIVMWEFIKSISWKGWIIILLLAIMVERMDWYFIRRKLRRLI